MSENFQSFNFCPEILRAIEALKFEKPTAVQAEAMPLLLRGLDVIASAQTGSGKTAAYTLPWLQRLTQDPNYKALVLSPTRELAEQIHRVIRELAKFFPHLRTSLLIGGTSMMPQRRTLQKNPQIIVATPGRLNDHLRQRSVKLDSVRYLVLDEADRMLDMGFEPQLRTILNFLPADRQSLLFSATFPPNIQELSKRYMKNPVRVTIKDSEASLPNIAESMIRVEEGTKINVLRDAIKTRNGSMLVFTRTQRRTERVAGSLESFGFTVGVIHGGRSQGQRKSALSAFRDGRFKILVATDVAARGLDIDHVEHVINFDLPSDPEDYTHRIGRTGRAGRSGEALSLLEREDEAVWRAIQNKTGKPPGSGSRFRRPSSTKFRARSRHRKQSFAR